LRAQSGPVRLGDPAADGQENPLTVLLAELERAATPAPAEAMLLELALQVSVDKHNCDLSGTEIVPAYDALIRLQPLVHEEPDRRVELSSPSRHRYRSSEPKQWPSRARCP
jgi:hypothetical protein